MVGKIQIYGDGVVVKRDFLVGILGGKRKVELRGEPGDVIRGGGEVELGDF